MSRLMTRLGIACVLLLAACQRPVDPPTDDPSGTTDPTTTPPVQPPALAATSSARLDPEGTTGVDEVETVTIHADVIGAQGPTGIVEELITPSGDAYQRNVETLFGDVDQLQPVDFTLPVAGTFIQMRQLTGTWTARLSVNGQVVATQTFELAP